MKKGFTPLEIFRFLSGKRNSVIDNKRQDESLTGFTLIELLVVIAILAVLSTAVVLVLNPVELIRQSRDSTRISDLAALNSTMALFLVDQPSATWSATSTCTSGTTLPGGIAGSCVTNQSSAVTGAGWVNINFGSISIGSPLSRLPLDPNNGSTNCGVAPDLCFYAYKSTTQGKYKIYANMESLKYKFGGGGSDVESNTDDGGTNNNWYEIGSDLSL